MHSLQAVFVDRDGTIGGTGHFIHPRDLAAGGRNCNGHLETHGAIRNDPQGTRQIRLTGTIEQ